MLFCFAIMKNITNKFHENYVFRTFICDIMWAVETVTLSLQVASHDTISYTILTLQMAGSLPLPLRGKPFV